MLKRLELSGFKSFAKKTSLVFDSPITAIVGPNGSGKSNIAEAFRWALGEQSLKSLRGKRGEDLIFSGGGDVGRMNRAQVSIIFDNTGKRFPVDFDEVTVTREVFRDGSNDYSLNGSKVRLRDVYELLSAVSLGSTGHHIISQGEADRLLNANIYDRRTMIEEALGLHLYQWKLAESGKKLDKTEQNIKEVESLRREIAPHLKFLKKQVERIEKADAYRRELKTLYLEYFKKEGLYLALRRAQLGDQKTEPLEALKIIEEKLRLAEQQVSKAVSPDITKELGDIEREIHLRRTTRDEAGRRLGRLEGMIEIKSERKAPSEEVSVIDYVEVKQLLREVEMALGEGEVSVDRAGWRAVIGRIRAVISQFVTTHRQGTNRPETNENELKELETERKTVLAEIERLSEEERKWQERELAVRQAMEREREASRGAEREIFELRSQRTELRSALATATAQEENLIILEQAFQTEIKEATALIDQEILRYEQTVLPGGYDPLADRPAQEERRRAAEKLKIRLEDMGAEGADVLEEYKETVTRDEFLAREHDDLLKSKTDLGSVIAELKDKLNTDFDLGLTKINDEFKKFFGLMFGGGMASLMVVRENRKPSRLTNFDTEEGEMTEVAVDEGGATKEGIDINVSLPRKKIKGLQMLSGGERALTSIALLFAMSQVNPPPFLILDETDAALDEANSRKYGDMVENLSKYSQLIVITHNRETMSRAGIIYGITMGGDAISRLLSIKFDEAAEYAK